MGSVVIISTKKAKEDIVGISSQQDKKDSYVESTIEGSIQKLAFHPMVSIYIATQERTYKKPTKDVHTTKK